MNNSHLLFPIKNIPLHKIHNTIFNSQILSFYGTHKHTNGQTIRKFVCDAGIHGTRKIKHRFFLTWKLDDGFPGKAAGVIYSHPEIHVAWTRCRTPLSYWQNEGGRALGMFQKIILLLSLRKIYLKKQNKTWWRFKVHSRRTPPSL